jgi:ATP-dependent DNA helicase DinG
LTSATLATTGGFAHTRDRLGIPEGALELALPSPFDYAQQAICYVPDDLPEPSDPRFVAAACARIEALVGMTRGRALILFTSHGKMFEAWQTLRGRWEWPTLVQSEGSKEAVLKRFRETRGAVLFATQTFWEGVDIVGEALSLVIIDKLPFQAPGDPIVDARVADLKAKGRNAFTDYQIPTAILALKQGIGRLIRHRGDRGIAAILDSRLARARYGRSFLDSLPPARRTADLVELATWWQELEENPVQIGEPDPIVPPEIAGAPKGSAGLGNADG